MLPVFEKTIEQVLSECRAAGGAFTAIRNGEVVVREVFGTADIETGRPITEESIFDLASDTKCMTTSVISQLCDEGKCSWEDPVRKFIPDFFLGDDYISSHITLKDCASHRSGICSQNMIRRTPAGEFPTRKSFVDRLKYFTLAKEFRDSFMYQNELYALLGYITELIEGKPWEECVLERIGRPLGIELAFRGIEDGGHKDVAYPHLTDGKEIWKTKHNSFWQNNPCGGARSNLLGFEKWLRVWCDGGKFPDGSDFVSPKMFQKMTTPISFWSGGGVIDCNRNYALGLAPSVYRGRKLVYHGGSINGFRSAMGFFPGLDSGYCIMINSTSQPLSVLKLLLCDAALGELRDDYSENVRNHLNMFYAPPAILSKLPPVQEITEEEKARFAGTWYNGAYKNLSVTPGEGNALHLKYYAAEGDVEFRGKSPEGVYLFKAYNTDIGGFLTDLRFDPDGCHAKMSFSEYFTPNPFVKTEG